MNISEAECGIACLTMVLRHFGVQVPADAVAAIIPRDHRGSTASALLDAARRFGLDGAGLEAPLRALPILPLPAILYWNANHYVVLEELGRDHARIADPGLGRRTIDQEELRASYSGIALTFSRVRDTAPRKSSQLGAALSLLTAKSLIATAAVAFAAALFTVAPLLWLAWFMDRAPEELPPWHSSLALLALWVTVEAALLTAREHAFSLLLTRLHRRIMTAVLSHATRLPTQWLGFREMQNLESRLVRGASVMSHYGDQLLVLLRRLASWLASLVCMLVLHPAFAALVLLLAIPIGLARAVIQRGLWRRLEIEREALTASTVFLHELAGNFLHVKASALETTVVSEWSKRDDGQVARFLGRRRHGRALGAVLETACWAIPIAILLVSAGSRGTTAFAAGSMTAFAIMAGALLFSTLQLAPDALSLRSPAASFLGALDIVSRETESHPGGKSRPDLRRISIELDKVQFRYAATDSLVIDGLDASLPAGSFTFFVGGPGSGKTTLAQLLVALHAPSAGRIAVNGHSLEDLDLQDYHGRVGLALGSPVRYSGTIADNLRAMRATLADEDLWDALRDVSMGDDIAAMRLGLNSRMDERELQWNTERLRRLEIARAIAHRPALVVLDEAIGDLDAESVDSLLQALARRGCTVVVLGRNPPRSNRADQVIRLARVQR